MPPETRQSGGVVKGPLPAVPYAKPTSTLGVGCKTRELVVARYREDLGWLSDVVGDFPITVVNKGPALGGLGSRVTVITLPNRQREAGSFLRFLVDRYESLPDLVFFTQANPFDHSPDLLFRLGLDYTKSTCLSVRYTDSVPSDEIKALDLVFDDEFGFPVRHGDCWAQAHSGTPAWFDPSAWLLVFETPVPEKYYFCFGNVRVVTRADLLLRSRDFYRWLLAECQGGEDGDPHTDPPLNPWSFEAVANAIWSPDYRVREVWTPAPASVVPVKRGCGCGERPRNPRR